MAKIIENAIEAFVQEDIKVLIEEMSWMKSKKMILCASLDELMDFIDEAIAANICAVDLETTGLNTRVYNGKPVEKIVGFCMSYEENSGIYVPVGHVIDEDLNLPFQEVLGEIRRLSTACVLIFHNAKFDLAFLNNYGVYVPKFEDTLILARLYDAGSKEIGLKHLSKVYLNQSMIDFKAATGKTQRFEMISPKISVTYAVSDALCTLGLYKFFINSDIIKEQQSIYALERRTLLVVLRMENNLVKIDIDHLKNEETRLKNKITKIEQEVYKFFGKEFNIGSSQQLGRILFEEHKFEYPQNAKTKTGHYSTDISTLQKIQKKYPILGSIIEYKELEKCLNTYIINLIKNCDIDSCVKLSFNQSGTDTGRFSSPGGSGIDIDGYSSVNVQSIPANYGEEVADIRRSFIARPGYKIVAMDFSGEELRVAANLSKEPKWINEFLEGNGDLHTATAKVIFKRDKIDKSERKLSKTVNFLTLYGGGANGLAEQAGISVAEARRIIRSFEEGLPTLNKWMKSEQKKSRRTKKASTVFGRIRPLHRFYDSGDEGLMAHGDRCATNFLVQGTCADILKTVMVRINNWVEQYNLQEILRILITVHDELVFEIKEDRMFEIVPILYEKMCLRDILQKILHWPVPFEIDAEYGDSWSVTGDFFKEHPEMKNTGVGTVISPGAPVTIRTPSNVLNGSDTTSGTSSIVSNLNVGTTGTSSIVSNPNVGTTEISNIVSTGIVPSSLESNTSIPEVIPTSNGVTTNELVYTIKDRSKGTLRRLNDILMFFMEEKENKIEYRNDWVLLKIRDKEGFIMNVSDIRVPADGFLACARLYGI